MNHGKAFLVLTFFMLFIALFAGGAMSGTDLTPNTPPDSGVTNNFQPLMSVQGVSTGMCGRTYVVRSGDTLSQIARNCGVSLQDLLAVNPGIYNANLIRPGQQINMVYRVTEAPSPEPTAQPTATAGQPAGQPEISGPRPGGNVLLAMEGFQPNAPVVVTFGPAGGAVRIQTEALTNAEGKLTWRLDVPTTAIPGETWQVKVTTVNPPNIVVSAPPVLIEQ